MVEAFVSAFRNRIDATNDALKDRFRLEQHRARRFWSLLTRTAAKLAAHTFGRLWCLAAVPTASTPIMRLRIAGAAGTSGSGPGGLVDVMMRLQVGRPCV